MKILNFLSIINFFFKESNRLKKTFIEINLSSNLFINSFKDSGIFDSILLLIFEYYFLIFVKSFLFYSNFLIYEKASIIIFYVVYPFKNYYNFQNFNFFTFLKLLFIYFFLTLLFFFLLV